MKRGKTHVKKTESQKFSFWKMIPFHEPLSLYANINNIFFLIKKKN